MIRLHVLEFCICNCKYILLCSPPPLVSHTVTKQMLPAFAVFLNIYFYRKVMESDIFIAIKHKNLVWAEDICERKEKWKKIILFQFGLMVQQCPKI